MDSGFKDQKKEAEQNLTEEEATIRSDLVSDVSYKLHLALSKDSTEYQGRLDLNFALSKKDPEGAIFLDFTGQTISSLTVNGVKAEKNPWSGHRVFLHGLIAVGKNHVEIHYTNDYDTNGEGFHYFKDGEDNQVYLYTNFEPFECHKLLPCFDQPSLRATLDLTVEAPADWHVFANNPGKTTEAGDKKTWAFEVTPKISTYLFAVVAGPYCVFEDKYDDRIPLKICCRKTMEKFIDTENLFTLTKQGLKFYEEFFGTKYPFAKYDQLFVPEFNQGAMENVGCVTFTEQYLFKDTPTRAALANRADTVLHEMAHMWFGNLVTPVWWDGLWLNESFATYMAGLCTCEATEFGTLSWQNFNSVMKSWAYREDQLPTTHPIQGKVPDTTATFLSFDGITYGKGSALLKQLVYIVGMDNFKKGMQYYFSKYAWKNTTITNFLEALEHCAGGLLDAQKWSAEWLQTSGLNTLALQITSKDGVVQECSITQTAPEKYPTLRHHHIQIVVYDHDAEKDILTQREAFPLVVQNTESTVVQKLVGSKKPTFVFINNNDYAYAKCFLDSESQNFAIEHMHKFQEALLRQVLWGSFYDLTRDAIMSSSKYIQLVVNQINNETDLKLTQTILDRCDGTIRSFVPNEQRPKEQDKLFNLAWNNFVNPSLAPAAKIIWERAIVNFGNSKDNVQKLASLLTSEEVKLRINSRFAIIEKANSWGIEGSSEWMSNEKDKSDAAVRAGLTCQAAVPTLEAKEAVWKKILDKESKMSLHEQEAMMHGFFWWHQRELTTPFHERYFSSIRDIFKNYSKEFAQGFAFSMFPYDPENDTVFENTKTLLASLTPEEEILQHAISERLDDLYRAKKCRSTY